MTDLHPSEGVRLLLARRAISDDRARAEYDGAVYTPTERFAYDATLERTGNASLSARGEPAPAEHEESLLKMARSMARAAARRDADGLEAWPPRILRWRGPGRGRG